MVRPLLTCNKVKGCTAVLYRQTALSPRYNERLKILGFYCLSNHGSTPTKMEGETSRPHGAHHSESCYCGCHSGTATNRSADGESAKHGKVCEQLGHTFITFGMTIDGIHGESCAAFIYEISKGMPHSTKQLLSS
jgi:hypothetical protein